MKWWHSLGVVLSKSFRSVCSSGWIHHPCWKIPSIANSSASSALPLTCPESLCCPCLSPLAGTTSFWAEFRRVEVLSCVIKIYQTLVNIDGPWYETDWNSDLIEVFLFHFSAVSKRAPLLPCQVWHSCFWLMPLLPVKFHSHQFSIFTGSAHIHHSKYVASCAHTGSVKILLAEELNDTIF